MRQSSASDRLARAIWTLGIALALVHVVLAFQLVYAWDHEAAVVATVRQTADRFGRGWRGGIYVNYVFLAIWFADVCWWWLAPASRASRSPRLEAARLASFTVHVLQRRGRVRLRHRPPGRHCLGERRAPRPARAAAAARFHMTHATVEARRLGWTFYYGWVVLGVAALAMVGTLPGRTQGLGLITEPLLRDLGVDRVAYAQINLVATLVGSLFCFGIGGLVDRRGSRVVLDGAGARCSACVVLAMSSVSERGDAARADHADARARAERAVGRQPGDAGQVVPPAADVGDGRLRAGDEHRLHDRVSRIVGAVVLARGWRVAWAAIGVGADRRSGAARVALRAVAIPRRTLELEAPAADCAGGPRRPTPRWATALRSPAFWVFGLASSLYGLVASGIGLFNESILAERGFAPDVYYTALAVTAITGLAGNFVAGAWADRGSLRRVLARRAAAAGRRAGRAAARDDDRARDGAGGGDGRRRRLRDGGVLQLLGQGLRPHASRPHSGRGAGDDRARVGGRPAAARLVRRRDRVVRRRVLRAGRGPDRARARGDGRARCPPARRRSVS